MGAPRRARGWPWSSRPWPAAAARWRSGSCIGVLFAFLGSRPGLARGSARGTRVSRQVRAAAQRRLRRREARLRLVTRSSARRRSPPRARGRSARRSCSSSASSPSTRSGSRRSRSCVTGAVLRAHGDELHRGQLGAPRARRRLDARPLRVRRAVELRRRLGDPPRLPDRDGDRRRSRSPTTWRRSGAGGGHWPTEIVIAAAAMAFVAGRTCAAIRRSGPRVLRVGLAFLLLSPGDRRARAGDSSSIASEVIDSIHLGLDAATGTTCCSRWCSPASRRPASRRPPGWRRRCAWAGAALRNLVLVRGVGGVRDPRGRVVRGHDGRAARRRPHGARRPLRGGAAARAWSRLRPGLAAGTCCATWSAASGALVLLQAVEQHDGRLLADRLLARHEPPDPERSRPPASEVRHAVRGRGHRVRAVASGSPARRTSTSWPASSPSAPRSSFAIAHLSVVALRFREPDGRARVQGAAVGDDSRRLGAAAGGGRRRGGAAPAG